MPISSVEMDVRPGGKWRLTMFTGEQRRESNWEGEYHEVDSAEAPVLTVTDQPGGGEYEVVTVVLTELGDARTEMHFEQRGGQLHRPRASAPARDGRASST